MTSKYIIYGLIDPRDGQLRYVGKSSSGLQRPRQHSAPSYARRDKTHKGNWVRQLLSLGLKYEVLTIEEHPTPEPLDEAEDFWIAYYKGIGCRLTNATNGGKGRPGHKLSEETKTKISRAHIGKVLSSEHRLKLSLAHKGQRRPLTQDHKDKIRVTLLGKSHELQRRISQSRSRGGSPFADQYGNTYFFQSEAALKLGIHQSNISRVLRGRFIQTHGYAFKYKD